MIGGDADGGAAPRPDLRRARAGRRRRRRARRAARATGGTAEQGYLHCGPQRRRPLREDGPQRHRVRPDGRLRRGPQHPQARQRRQAAQREPTPRRRRCATRSTTSTTSTSPTSPRSGGAAASIASWLLDLTAAALADEPELDEFAGRVSDSGEGRWTLARRDRRGGAGAGAHRRAVRALQLAGRGRLRRTSAVRHALQLRRPRREGSRRTSVTDGGAAVRTRWCSSAPPATSPTRRSSRRCTRWSRRGTLDVPVIGVAAVGLERATSCASARRESARPSTAASTRPRSRSSAALLRYVDGDYARPGDLRRGCARRSATRSIRSTTWRSRRACSRPWSRGWRSRAAPTARGSSSRSRSAAISRRRASSTRTLHTVFRRASDLPHRPLPRQGGGAEPPRTSASPTRSSSRSGTATTSSSVQITMAETFGVAGPRRASTTRPARSATWCRTTCCRSWRYSRWSRRSAHDAEAHPRRAGEGVAQRSARSSPDDLVRGQFRGLPRRAGRGARLHGRDLRGGAAVRRLVALGGRAVLHPRRQSARR